MENFILKCSRCGNTHPFDVKGRCACGGTFLVEYDLERIQRSWRREQLSERPWTMWRYQELLPIQNPQRIVSLGEGGTPLLRLHDAEKRFSLRGLYSKREEMNPTGSFKARGFSAAVSLLNERGIRKVAVNSNGNAATALAAYAAHAGMEAYVFVPKDCPGLIVEETIHYGAHTFLVDGYIQDAGLIVEKGIDEQGWFHLGTLREPGRAEGKKTMGLEVAEQLGWRFPDVVVYPTGGGSGIIGLWRAFQQLKELGWVQGDLPRLITVQEDGCKPIVNLFHGYIEPSLAETDITSSPTGLRVPCPPDGQLIVSILRSTGGTAISISLEEIQHAAKELSRIGLSASPEGAATWAGMTQLLDRHDIRNNETVVLFNTCHAAKYWPWNVTYPIKTLKIYDDFKAINSER